MPIKKFYNKLPLIHVIGCILIVFSSQFVSAQNGVVVRIAKLEIDPARLKEYNAALKEEIETSVLVEPGVLTLYAVAEKDKPSHVTIMEVYASAEAYQAHLQTPHFMKYKNSTKEMVRSLELIETIPIALGTKNNKKPSFQNK